MSAKFGKIRRQTVDLVTLEHLKKLCIMFYVVNNLAPSFFIGALFLQVLWLTI